MLKPTQEYLLFQGDVLCPAMMLEKNHLSLYLSFKHLY